MKAALAMFGAAVLSLVSSNVLQTDLPFFQKDVAERLQAINSGRVATTPSPTPPPGVAADSHQWRRSLAMQLGMQRYTELKLPVLAIFAAPHRGVNDQTATEAQANAFEKGVPSARVVRLPGATHAIWSSNEADVLREIRAFMSGLH